MKSMLAAAIISAGIAAAAPLAGQTAPAFAPIDVAVAVPPRSFVAGGATHLVYELHITNLSSSRTTFNAVDVMDRSASVDAAPLLHLDGDALEAALQLPGAPLDAEKRVLPGGRVALLFVWVTVPTGAVPAGLTHRFDLRLANRDVPASSKQGHSTPP